MLILCVGPDTFRAQQKAQELRAYFITKYDTNGSSVERLDEGRAGVQQLVEHTGTASLFAPRRFFYGRDLVSECPKALLSPLARVLSTDAERMIIVSIESDAPASTLLKELEQKTKVVRYDHPLLQGSAFVKWVCELAVKLGVRNDQLTRRIADVYDGDSWMASSELMKAAAGAPFTDQAKNEDASIYDVADRYLSRRGSFREFLNDENLSAAMLSVMLQQTRARLRVRDQATDGLHPFVIKKMRSMRADQAEEDFANALSAIMSQRGGLGDESEAATLF